MNTQLTEDRKQNLSSLIDEIKSLIVGFSREDMEYIFEEAIIGLYQLSTRSPWGEGKWKIVERETGREVQSTVDISDSLRTKLFFGESL